MQILKIELISSLVSGFKDHQLLLFALPFYKISITVCSNLIECFHFAARLPVNLTHVD